MSLPIQPAKESPPPRDATEKVFCTTQWTQVRRAKTNSPEGRQALADLCTAYYEPVATFLRYTVRDADAARDLAHEFFANVLSGGAIVHAEQERGRFRSYLLGAVKHFLAHHHESAQRLKRGGGAKSISLNDSEVGADHWLADDSRLSPDAAFDRKWALNVVARALSALRQECVLEGRSDFFEQVKPWLTGEAVHGEQTALAAGFGMNANAFKVAVHRMKKRFRQLLRTEIACTLEDPRQVEDEMRTLFAALNH